MKKVFVGNLSWKATEDQLKSLFETVCEVVSVKIVTDQMTGKSKGFAFVELGGDNVQEAIDKLNNHLFLDRNLRVSQAQDRPDRGPRDDYRGGGGGGGYNNDRSSYPRRERAPGGFSSPRSNYRGGNA